jgi:hypothetical protein
MWRSCIIRVTSASICAAGLCARNVVAAATMANSSKSQGCGTTEPPGAQTGSGGESLIRNDRFSLPHALLAWVRPASGGEEILGRGLV